MKINKQNNSILLFVYGTLKRKHYNHRLLDHPSVEFVGEFVTEPRFTMISCGGFPAVLPEGETPIKGELYRINSEMIKENIFSLEGYSGERNSPLNWYDTVDVQTNFGTAQMFVFKKNRDNRPVIKTGEWL